MSLTQTLIPTMFHRRVVLLALVALVSFSALGIRLVWMTAVDGAESLEVARSRLVRRAWIPTTRGRILDRNSNVLSMDRAGYDLAVDYRLLTGDWQLERARRAARRANKDTWDLLETPQREEIIESFRAVYEDHARTTFRAVAIASGMTDEEIEERRREIVDRIETMHDSIVSARVGSRINDRERRGYPVTQRDRENFLRASDRPIREQQIPHVIATGIDDEPAFALIRMGAKRVRALPEGTDDDRPEMISPLPGLVVSDTTERIHPHARSAVVLDRSSFPGPLRADETLRVEVEDVGSLLLGTIRDSVYKEDTQRRAEELERNERLRAEALTDMGTDRGSYRTDDRVGHTGLESTLEHELRGLRGIREEDLQTGAVTETDPVPGADVTLTIDTQLTARIRAILDPRVGLTRVQPWHDNQLLPVGTELDAGVVVLEVDTGEILALVSTPAPPHDGDWSRLGLNDETRIERFLKVREPFAHRALERPYQPGSIAKALVLCGAAKLGAYSRDERIPATGHLYPDRPDMLRSWIFKDYGITHADQLGRDPDATDALMVSSNVFFFTLGQRLGPQGIRETYELFGIGTPYELGFGRAWSGSLGAFTDSGTAPISSSDSIQMGIGQGPVTWTPLHAADSYATIARAGHRIRPTLIRDRATPRIDDLGIPTWATISALDGLEGVTTNPDYGTGHHITYNGIREPIFNTPGVRVWGKTGTATASPLVIDPDDDGPLEPIVARRGDHSWYVTLVGPENGPPTHSIAVVVDYAGSGARVSGPINNQIIRALVDLGYIEGSTP